MQFNNFELSEINFVISQNTEIIRNIRNTVTFLLFSVFISAFHYLHIMNNHVFDTDKILHISNRLKSKAVLVE